MEEAALEHDRAGRKGNEVRGYYQGEMRLTDEAAKRMKQIAADCNEAIRKLDLQVQEIVRKAWEPYRARGVPAGETPPAAPLELFEIDRKKVETIAEFTKKLEDDLGPRSFQRVDTYLQKTFSKQISTTPVVPPTAPSQNSEQRLTVWHRNATILLHRRGAWAQSPNVRFKLFPPTSWRSVI